LEAFPVLLFVLLCARLDQVLAARGCAVGEASRPATWAQSSHGEQAAKGSAHGTRCGQLRQRTTGEVLGLQVRNPRRSRRSRQAQAVVALACSACAKARTRPRMEAQPSVGRSRTAAAGGHEHHS